MLQRRNTYRLADFDYTNPDYAYFVTIQTQIRRVAHGCTLNPLTPFTSCPSLAEQASNSLHFYRDDGKWLLFAYCVMPDHLHLLVSPCHGANLSSILSNYKSYITRAAWENGVIGDLWQRSYYDHILRRSEDANGVIAYILDNPVKAELVETWQEWPWCGMPDTI